MWGLPDGARRLMERREEGDEGAERMQTEDESEVPVISTSRALYHHPRSTSVSGEAVLSSRHTLVTAIHLDPFTLVTGDGLATVLQVGHTSPSLPSHLHDSPPSVGLLAVPDLLLLLQVLQPCV